jgi:DNA-directed RNA polymerase specialized sigma24 family protein
MQPMSAGSALHKFETTRWSIVIRAGKRDGQDALRYLCQAYWHPVYAFIRSLGVSADDALDVTQGFFSLTLLERDDLAKLDSNRGKFRSWLRTCARYYVGNWRRHENRRPLAWATGIDIDVAYAERCLQRDAAQQLTPDRVLDQRWALTVIDRSMSRLREQYRKNGKEALVDQLERRLNESEDQITDDELVARLGKKAGAVRTARSRMLNEDLARHLAANARLHLRAEVAETLADSECIDTEVRELLDALS